MCVVMWIKIFFLEKNNEFFLVLQFLIFLQKNFVGVT